MTTAKKFSAITLSALIGLSVAAVSPVDAAPTKKKVKKCKPDFEYSLVFMRCIRDHGGNNN